MSKPHLSTLFGLALLASSGLASAGTVATSTLSCGGDAPLRNVTLSSGLTCINTGLGNLSTATVTSLGYAELERDVTSQNGGLLQITGAGATSGTWSLASSVWDSYGSVFLYVHLGGPQANGLPNPDWFIVQLQNAATSGSWSATYNYGLSAVAVLGGSPLSPKVTTNASDVPEPGSLALVAAALAGAGLFARRTRQRAAQV